MTNEQIKALIADLSIEEKAGQLLQVAGNFYDKDSLTTGALDYFKITDKELELTGSILSISGAEKLKKIQDECMAKQPHHIPQVFMLDIINGYETIYPVPMAQGASFNPDMAKKCAAMAAIEGSAAGIHVTFSPMVDLVRDARWGRVMESTGEDSYLNGVLGAAMVEGYQGDDIKSKGKMGACVKHFAAYGGAEGGRDYDTVELSERTLREEYLPAYKACIDDGVKLVMTSFNTIKHVPAAGNKWLMKKVLRDEMGFDGMLISDYGAIVEMVNHNIAKDEVQAAELSINAGVDMDMMSLCYVHGLKKLLEEGKISQEMIDEAVFRVLSLKNELGLFDNPYKDASAEDEKKYILCDEHRKLAMEAAMDSFVLLENDDKMLPLSKDESVCFVGPFVDSKKVYGSWTFPSNDDSIVSIRQGIENIGAKNVSYAQGSQFLSNNMKLKNGEILTYDDEAKEKLLKEAVDAAKSSSKAVVCIGEHAQFTGEAASRTNITIPEEQMELLRAVSEVNENVVTLVVNGRPLELAEGKKLSKAVMVVWFPGTETGNAIANVIYGNNEPGGRVPMSFPYTVGQEPCYYNRLKSGRPNNGTLEQGYVMGYIDQIDKMLYPFGYGKTYTEFEYSTVEIEEKTGEEKPVLTLDKTLTASVVITNKGQREGTETVQMYVQDLFGSVCRPVKQLRGFEKVTLAPGESKKVSFVIKEEMLRFYNIDMEYTSEAGDFKVYIGPDSETDNFAEFVI
ncbi:MAG: beta-glucosidase BglX [Lachnospiraceae bacterium]|nr:beta-glucosidase BglX [Lachnospiraceae bacterium]